MESKARIYNKKYKFVSELGKGAYGTINLAEDLTLQGDMVHEAKNISESEKFVAIKQMYIDVKTPFLTLLEERRH